MRVFWAPFAVVVVFDSGLRRTCVGTIGTVFSSISSQGDPPFMLSWGPFWDKLEMMSMCQCTCRMHTYTDLQVHAFGDNTGVSSVP